MDKPWLNLFLNSNDKWWITSKNLPITPKQVQARAQDIICYYVIQEANMGGVYHRVFIWFKDDDDRYLELKTVWDFDKEFLQLNDSEIVTNKYNNNYKVSCITEYVKILEIVS